VPERATLRQIYIIFAGVFSMPKMKTKSGAKKRLNVLGGGGVKRSMAFKRHILTKKTTKNKRQLRGTTMVDATNMPSVRAMLPYA
jgi:large subunit ribosomal protein L35